MREHTCHRKRPFLNTIKAIKKSSTILNYGNSDKIAVLQCKYIRPGAESISNVPASEKDLCTDRAEWRWGKFCVQGGQDDSETKKSGIERFKCTNKGAEATLSDFQIT